VWDSAVAADAPSRAQVPAVGLLCNTDERQGAGGPPPCHRWCSAASILAPSPRLLNSAFVSS
jgi:hypothetical protein